MTTKKTIDSNTTNGTNTTDGTRIEDGLQVVRTAASSMDNKGKGDAETVLKELDEVVVVDTTNDSVDPEMASSLVQTAHNNDSSSGAPQLLSDLIRQEQEIATRILLEQQQREERRRDRNTCFRYIGSVVIFVAILVFIFVQDISPLYLIVVGTGLGVFNICLSQIAGNSSSDPQNCWTYSRRRSWGAPP